MRKPRRRRGPTRSRHSVVAADPHLGQGTTRSSQRLQRRRRSDILWRQRRDDHRLAGPGQWRLCGNLATPLQQCRQPTGNRRHRRLQRRRRTTSCGATTTATSPTGWARPMAAFQQLRQRLYHSPGPTGRWPAPATSTATAADDILWRNDVASSPTGSARPMAASSAKRQCFHQRPDRLAHRRHRRLQRRRPRRHPLAQRRRQRDRLAGPGQWRLRRQ